MKTISNTTILEDKDFARSNWKSEIAASVIFVMTIGILFLIGVAIQ